MKRILYMAPLYIAVLLAGCTEDGQPDIRRAIGVDVAGLEPTKAESAEQVTSLGVFGYSTGGDNFNSANLSHKAYVLFNNKKAYRDNGGEWTYEMPLVYWPVDLSTRNTFFAYSPWLSPDGDGVSFSAVKDAAGYPLLDYSVPADPDRQIDLLWAKPVFDIKRDAMDGKVLFDTLQHVLSPVYFIVIPVSHPGGTRDNESFRMTSLSIGFSYLLTGGKLNLGTGNWENMNAESDVFYPVNLTSGVTLNMGTANHVIAGRRHLMFIPQVVEKERSAPVVNISFLYSYTGEEAEEYEYSIPFPGMDLEAGKLSVFIIRLQADQNPVIFRNDNAIAPWDPDTGNLNPEEQEIY